MRLVLHPKVYSDIDRIMAYYEEVATADLANQFYAELRYFMTAAAARAQSFSRFARAIVGESTFIVFLIIFFFESSATPFAFSSSVITADIHLLA